MRPHMPAAADAPMRFGGRRSLAPPASRRGLASRGGGSVRFFPPFLLSLPFRFPRITGRARVMKTRHVDTRDLSSSVRLLSIACPAGGFSIARTYERPPGCCRFARAVNPSLPGGQAESNGTRAIFARLKSHQLHSERYVIPSAPDRQ